MKKLLQVGSSSEKEKRFFWVNLLKIPVMAGLVFYTFSIPSYGSLNNQEQEEWKKAALKSDNISNSPVGSDQNTGDFHDQPAYNHKKDSYYTAFELPPHSLSPEELVYELPKYKLQKLIGERKESQDGNPREKIIHNSDRRERLNRDVIEARYNFNVYLEIYYANVKGKAIIYYGSGSLIAENLILTAGHNLYDSRDGGYPDRIDCFVACYRDTTLAEAAVFPNLDFKNSTPSIFLHPHYIKEENHLQSSSETGGAKEETYLFSPYDIGLIVFNQDQVNKMKKTWSATNFAIPLFLNNFNEKEKLLKEFLKRDLLRITGYPGERYARSMKGKTTAIDWEHNKICYDIDTDKGQSGSGICFQNNNKKAYCVGVHVCAGNNSEKFNIGVLIDDEINALIGKYLLPRKE